jgi:ribosomal protein S12 methylthiotransferase
MYFDIPLQHISDSILKSMRRGTTQAKKQNYLRILEPLFPVWQFVQL